MVYLTFIILTVPYLLYLGRVRFLRGRAQSLNYFLGAIPIILLWCLVIGGQYNVGTDYFSYLEIFSGRNISYIEDRGELAFVWFVKFCNSIGFSGQDLFFVYAFIWVLLLLFSFKNLVGIRNVYLMMFVFITFSTAFNNQMNIVRQYTAIYLFTYAFSLFFQRKYAIAFIFGVLTILTHVSSFIVLLITPLIIFFSKRLKSNKSLILLLSVAVLLSFFLNLNILKYALSIFDQYAHYLQSGRIESTGVIFKLTKLLYLPLMLYSVVKRRDMNLTKNENVLFNIGILSYCCKIALLNISIVGRIGSYFEILMCLPIVFLLRWFTVSKKQVDLFLVLMYLLVPYIVKVTYFATAEYSYHSIFLL